MTDFVELKTLRHSERVRVHYTCRHGDQAEGDELEPPIAGMVVRCRRADSGAWVALDYRAADIHHQFPADDPEQRGNHVLTYPEFCEATK